jgi:hypothetical protein
VTTRCARNAVSEAEAASDGAIYAGVHADDACIDTGGTGFDADSEGVGAGAL